MLVPAPGAGGMPVALAFDASRRLWVADRAAGTLSRYDHAQLFAGGPQVPGVILSGVGTPTGMAFDAAGTLWVANADCQDVPGFHAGHLRASGSPTPDVVLSPSGELQPTRSASPSTTAATCGW